MNKLAKYKRDFKTYFNPMQSGGSNGKVIAEDNEYIKTNQGKVLKIEDAPTHNDKVIQTPKGLVKAKKGGILLDNVDSVLSATHENRNSKDRLYTHKDEEIKIMPKEAKVISEAFHLPIKFQKKGISPSKLLDQLIEKRKTTLAKYENLLTPRRFSESTFNAIKANKAVIASIPSVEELYDKVFEYSESKKSENTNNTAQLGKKLKKYY